MVGFAAVLSLWSARRHGEEGKTGVRFFFSRILAECWHRFPLSQCSRLRIITALTPFVPLGSVNRFHLSPYHAAVYPFSVVSWLKTGTQYKDRGRPALSDPLFFFFSFNVDKLPVYLTGSIGHTASAPDVIDTCSAGAPSCCFCGYYIRPEWMTSTSCFAEKSCGGCLLLFLFSFFPIALL